MFKNRLYKSGTQWGFWRWSFVPTGYITRLHLIKTPWFAMCLHWLNHPDPEPWLHDHPVSFLSLILRGWYIDKRFLMSSLCRYFLYTSPDDCGREYLYFERKNKWWNYISAETEHSIIQVGPKTLTLCFMGPKVREWGYHTDKGWVYWKDYNREKYGTSKNK